MRWKKSLLFVGVALTLALLTVGITLAWVHEPRPEGVSGEEAEALARRMEQAVDVDAWARTGAVRWTFAGRNRHLWDRSRHGARVAWDEEEVLLYEGSASGRAYHAGAEVHGARARELLEAGHAAWVNDSFWLNPIAKIRDEGVTLGLVDGDRLLVSYSSGGLTPGDAYLWLVASDGTPRAWKMWVSILPVGGVETTWGGWVTLDTGARIATRHEGPLGFVLELDDVAGAETLEELVEGADPFAPLFED